MLDFKPFQTVKISTVISYKYLKSLFFYSYFPIPPQQTHEASHVTGRFVAGDFNGDGKDDIATMYDYTDGSEIHVFLSTGSSFKGWQSWYSDKTSYKSSCIDDRMVAGDFNGDGKDDIATMYAYDTYNTHMHVFLSTGTSFKGWDTWYKDTTSYSVNCVNGRMTAGDFNGDGKDDIATMYDYGDSKCEMHVFLSNGKKFEGWYDWSEDTSFSANAVTSRFVAGDFNGDGRCDVAAMYDYDRTYVIFHMYISEGTKFNHEWWNKIDNYNANRISNTVGYSDSYSATFKFTKKDITPTVKPTAIATAIPTAKPTATAIPTAKPTPTVKPTVTPTPTETPYDGLAVTAKKVTAKAGSEVEIPISISKNPGIAGFKFKISYDKSVLIPISISKGSAFGNGTLNSNINQGGDLSNLDEVTAYWSNPSNVSADGEMFTVKFKVSDNATDGTYPITLTYEDGDITNQTFDNINPKIINGAVTLTKVKKGDIYEDGVVNTKDGVLLSQYLAKWNINFTENQMTAADVYEDGVVNTKDGVKLSQVLAKWDNVTLSSEISASADGIAVSIPNIDTNAGEYVDVPVTLSKNSGIAGFNFNINYVDDRLAKVITKILSKMLFNLAVNNNNRGSIPFHIIIEEAHRYVQKDKDTDILGYNIFDRITKEGRKYGVFLGLITQRPSELSDTAISQCSNFIILRTLHPKDLQYIKEMVPNISTEVVQQLKSLQPGNCIAFGSAFKIPISMHVEFPNPAPNSNNVDLSTIWYQ